MLIREYGNMGSLNKLERITQALDVAKRFGTKVAISLDPLVYGGDNVTILEGVKDYDFNKSELFVGEHTFPWWDIQKVNLIF